MTRASKFILIVILCFVLTPVYAGRMDYLKGVEGVEGVGCTKDTSNLVYDQSSTTNAWILSSATQALGQCITASSFVLYGITITFAASTSSCYATVRVGTSSDLTTYDEEWNNIEVGGPGDFEFVSQDNDTFTTICWGVVEVSGDCRVGFATGNPIGSSDMRYTADDDWDMGTVYTDNRDITGQVHKCQ